MTAFVCGVSSGIIQSFRSHEVLGPLEFSDLLRARHLNTTVIPSATMTSNPSTGPRMQGNSLVVTCPEQSMNHKMERHTLVRTRQAIRRCVIASICTRLPNVIVVRKLNPDCVVCVLTGIEAQTTCCGALGSLATMWADIHALETIVKHRPGSTSNVVSSPFCAGSRLTDDARNTGRVRRPYSC